MFANVYSKCRGVDRVLVFDTTDEVAWGGTNVREKLLLCGPGVVADLSDFILKCLANVLLSLLECGSIGPASLDDHVFADLDWVTGLTHLSNLFLGTVGDAGVRHGVTMVSIGKCLEVDWTILNDVLAAELDGFLHHEHVLAINLEAWDFVTAFVEVSVQSSSLLRCSHSIGVVFTKVDNGQFPETSDVGSLGELTLVGSTITVHGDSEVLLVSVFLSESESSSNG